jgi:hypothetical protein
MIVFILTDGQISDKEETYNLLIKCSRLPISLFVFGIGQENFGMMNELNDCMQIRDKTGKKTIRDFIKFV